MTTPPREIAALTSVRGYLALWVVAYHFWNNVVRLVPLAAAASPVAELGHMAVPAFFMLSGFVLSYTYAARFEVLRRREVIRFLWLRLARIYPVHLVTLLAVAAMVWVSDLAGFRLTDSGYSTTDFVRNVFLMHSWVPHFQLNWNYPSWSISSEWFAYFLFPFVTAGVLRPLTTPRRAVALAAIALAASVGMTWWRPWPYFELVLVLPTFVAGTAIYWVVRDRPAATGWWWPEVLVVASAASCSLPAKVVAVCLLFCTLFFLILALVRVGPRASRLWTGRPALFLGEVSYSLYMTHTLAQKVLYRLLPAQRFESADGFTRAGVLVGYAALIAACCLLTYYLVERPCRRQFKKFAATAEWSGGQTPSL